MKNKIAILYTTFLRDELMYKTVKSILDNLSDNCFLFIADQGLKTEEKNLFYKSLPADKVFQWYLDYDCGLSIARNFLVKEAKSKGFAFCLLTADSIMVTQPLENLNFYIDFLESHEDYGIVGFKLNNRVSWEKLLRKNWLNDKFMIKNASERQISNNQSFLRCDIVSNFFLAKTECLFQTRWDNDLKLGEHEIFFWNLKTQTYWKVFYNELYEAQYIKTYNEDYKKMRMRLYKQFVPLMMKKYHLNMWLGEDK